MASGGPDWVRRILVTVNVDVTPVIPQPSTEKAITRLARASPDSTTYVTVVEWEVDEDKVGILRFVEMESDDYEHTRFRLTIAGIVQFTDVQIEASLTLEWPDVKLAAEAVVLLEARSTDTTEVNVDGDILGKEVG